MPAMISFYDWLAKQKNLRTPVGDLARTAARDKSFPREVVTLDAVLDYARTSSKGSAQAVAIARAAYQAYERSLRPPPSM
jgi:uncharacterized protein YozE (UPF0346 family)